MSQYKFLVVEDSPLMRQLITFALRRLKGSVIDEAEDGVVGLKKLSNQKYDLVILDINMPIMNGLKVIGHIRTNPKLADLPILVVTTEGVEEDRARALELGANEYLTKPVDSSDVYHTVKKLLKINQ
jgi:two-component system chemotaxis response regulator CheY